jgi:hypothetical protein
MRPGKKVMAYHEAGHAVVARVLGVGVPYAALFPVDSNSRAGVPTASAAWHASRDVVAARIAGHETDAKVPFAGAQSGSPRHF